MGILNPQNNSFRLEKRPALNHSPVPNLIHNFIFGRGNCKEKQISGKKGNLSYYYFFFDKIKYSYIGSTAS